MTLENAKISRIDLINFWLTKNTKTKLMPDIKGDET